MANRRMAWVIPESCVRQLTIAVVLGLGDIVSHHGGEQRVNTSESCEGKSGDDGGDEDGAPIKAFEGDMIVGEERQGKSGRNLTDGGHAVHVDKTRDDSHHDKGHKRGGHFLGEQREEVDNGHRSDTEEQRSEAGLGESLGKSCQLVDHRSTTILSHKWIKLLQDDNDTDTTHKTAENGIRYITDIFADFDEAKENLEKSTENGGKGHRDKDLGEGSSRGGPRAGDKGGGNDGHWTRRTRNLTVGTAEEGGKEAEEHSSSESYIGSERSGVGTVDTTEGLYTEGQCQRQRNDTGGNAAEEVAFEIAKEFHIILFSNFFFSREPNIQVRC